MSVVTFHDVIFLKQDNNRQNPNSRHIFVLFYGFLLLGYTHGAYIGVFSVGLKEPVLVIEGASYQLC